MKDQVPKAFSRKKHLFICGSWPEVVKILSYLESLGDHEFHDFLILADPNMSRGEQEFIEIRQALQSFGHRQVDWLQARQPEYEELHLSPAYAMLTDDKRETDSINYKFLIAHADGVRNGVYVDHRLAPHVRGVVHYGFRLIETSILSTKLQMQLVENSYVVPFASISIIWQKLDRFFGAPARPVGVSETDLLVCERYWGARHYEMRDGADPEAYLSSVLRLAESHYERVIFRPTTFHGTEKLIWNDAIHYHAKSQGVPYVTWAELFDGQGGAKILDHPEAQFFIGNMLGSGGLYAFDGSLSVLIAALSENTRVHWADSASIEGLFVDKRLARLIEGQGQWMRKVADTHKASETTESLGDFYTDGSFYKSIIQEQYLENTRAQLADREAQFTASLSWRVTKPLRTLGQLFTRGDSCCVC
jgi:hypothetical protein